MIRFVKYAFALVIAALLLSLVYAGPAAAQSSSPHATLVTAEQLYARGEYALAAQGYQQLADQGYADSALFYNMGLAYWMAGDLGRALWSFKSAQAIDPRDAAVEDALQEVRSQIAAANAEAPGDPAPIALLRGLEDAEASITPAEQTVLARPKPIEGHNPDPAPPPPNPNDVE